MSQNRPTNPWIFENEIPATPPPVPTKPPQRVVVSDLGQNYLFESSTEEFGKFFVAHDWKTIYIETTVRQPTGKISGLIEIMAVKYLKNGDRIVIDCTGDAWVEPYDRNNILIVPNYPRAIGHIELDKLTQDFNKILSILNEFALNRGGWAEYPKCLDFSDFPGYTKTDETKNG